MNILENVSLKSYSTFGIGGKARFLVLVTSFEDLIEAVRFARERNLPVLCIGKGSNCLFHDAGFFGLVIVNQISFLHDRGLGVFEVGAGFSFAQLGRLTSKEGFSGLEFAAGIPATVGGAIYMNAGASGQETKDVLLEVTSMNALGDIVRHGVKELAFGYRTSSFQKNKEIICSALFQLQPSEAAYNSMKDKVEYRMKTQPYGAKSIGCFFRNPPGNSAGRLIEEAGMKGFSIGDAEVSSVHANFLVNKGSASAEDVCQLAKCVVEKVWQTAGVRLESEAKIMDPEGRFG